MTEIQQFINQVFNAAVMDDRDEVARLLHAAYSRGYEAGYRYATDGDED